MCLSSMQVAIQLSDLPSVIIWDPIAQFTDIFKEFKIICSECDKEMKFMTWQDGRIQRNNIYSSEGYILLVCKIYTDALLGTF